MGENSKPQHPAKELASIVASSYGVVLFSAKPLPSILFLAATFYDPFAGLLGLLGSTSANAVAFFLHTDRAYVRAGVFGVNGVLVGLGLGLYLPRVPETFALTIVGGALSAILAAGMLSVLSRRRQLPILSLAFVITTWTLLLAARAFILDQPDIPSGSAGIPAALEDAIRSALPESATRLISAFSFTMFQKNMIAGMMILIGILIASRLSVLLGIGGAIVGLWTYVFLGGDPDSSTAIMVMLNSILIAIALSGFFIAPALSSIVYGLFGLIIGVIITVALQLVLKPVGLPVLVAPFNIVTLMLLYPLHSPILYSSRIGLLPIPLHEIGTPEENRKWFLHRYGRRGKIRYQLPFYGTWYVWQGEHGSKTHTGTQAYAYDFVVVDGNKKTYRALGLSLDDYHCFGLPILSPANGKIVAVVSHINDNPPGILNEAENWGNYVIIEHAQGEYTEISHFKQSSISAKVGDMVTAGQVLGLCGNSGYSSQPHLHIQRQKGPFVGAETLPMRFSGITVVQDGEERSFDQSNLIEGTLVRGSQTDEFARESPDKPTEVPASVGP
jgi:urea transporter